MNSLWCFVVVRLPSESELHRTIKIKKKKPFCSSLLGFLFGFLASIFVVVIACSEIFEIVFFFFFKDFGLTFDESDFLQERGKVWLCDGMWQYRKQIFLINHKSFLPIRCMWWDLTMSWVQKILVYHILCYTPPQFAKTFFLLPYKPLIPYRYSRFPLCERSLTFNSLELSF